MASHSFLVLDVVAMISLPSNGGSPLCRVSNMTLVCNSIQVQYAYLTKK